MPIARNGRVVSNADGQMATHEPGAYASVLQKVCAEIAPKVAQRGAQSRKRASRTSGQTLEWAMPAIQRGAALLDADVGVGHAVKFLSE